LLGTVASVFPSHLALRVFGIFNAIVYKKDISEKILELQSDESS